MSVLTIRAHRRYALRLPVKLHRAGTKPVSGLMIELSQQGARISNLGKQDFEEGQQVELASPDGIKLTGTVRWTHDGLAGIKLQQSLHAPEIARFLESNRDNEKLAARRYGT